MLATNNMQDWTVICDFDGTITPFDVSDAIFERFADKAWEEIEQDWKLGKISARECMRRQVEMVQASAQELNAFLDTVPIRAGFKDFVAFCAENALSIMVVSDGMDYAIRRILFRHGLENLPVIANRLVFNDRDYRLDFPFGVAGCPGGVCKCSIANAISGPVMLIGDGHSDCCVAKNADFIFAMHGKELEWTCRAERYSYLPFTDFFEIRAALSEVRAPFTQAVHNFG